MKDFSTIVAPMSEILKGKSFEWNEKANSASKEIKARLTSTPMLALPNFSKVFKVVCDAPVVGIGVVLSLTLVKSLMRLKESTPLMTRNCMPLSEH